MKNTSSALTGRANFRKIRTLLTPTSAVTLAVIIGLGALAVYALQTQRLYIWHWGDIWGYRRLFMQGLFMTLKISAFSCLAGFVMGLALSFMRISQDIVLKSVAWAYIETIRNTPLLVQILIVYYLIGTVFNLTSFIAAVLSLSVFVSAYVAEILRSAIEAIPRGQTEAARSLGMTYFRSMRHIILPQAIKIALPPLAGQFISLIKDSSLLSVIAIAELTMTGRQIVTTTFRPLEVFIVVAFLYFALTFPLSLITRYWEKKLTVGRA